MTATPDYPIDPRTGDPDCELYALMSALSEDCWCAGWLIGTEYALWKLAHAGGGDWGVGVVPPEDAAELLRLKDELGGWWTWPWECAASVGPIFVRGWTPEGQGEGEPAQ